MDIERKQNFGYRIRKDFSLHSLSENLLQRLKLDNFFRPLVVPNESSAEAFRKLPSVYIKMIRQSSWNKNATQQQVQTRCLQSVHPYLRLTGGNHLRLTWLLLPPIGSVRLCSWYSGVTWGQSTIIGPALQGLWKGSALKCVFI